MHQHERRQGPRREQPAELASDNQGVQERRATDRRKGKPGLAGLLGAIFGARRLDRTE